MGPDVDAEQFQGETSESSGHERPGEMLARARKAQGLSIADIAARTRISIRQLDAIERDDFSSLPSVGYAVGFGRNFARMVGLDERVIGAAIREELGAAQRGSTYVPYEPLDPARVPPRWLAWTAAALALLLAVGYGVWRAQLTTKPTDSELASRVQTPAVSAPAAPALAPPMPTDPVVLTARSDVWLRIYDQSGKKLLEKQMAAGESYTVPADADNPMILTGRPEALAVTVAGKPVAPLGPPQRSVADLPISAAALLARSTPAGPPPPPGAPDAGNVSPPPASASPAGSTPMPRPTGPEQSDISHRSSSGPAQSAPGPSAAGSGPSHSPASRPASVDSPVSTGAGTSGPKPVPAP